MREQKRKAKNAKGMGVAATDKRLAALRGMDFLNTQNSGMEHACWIHEFVLIPMKPHLSDEAIIVGSEKNLTKIKISYTWNKHHCFTCTMISMPSTPPLSRTKPFIVQGCRGGLRPVKRHQPILQGTVSSLPANLPQPFSELGWAQWDIIEVSLWPHIYPEMLSEMLCWSPCWSVES